MVVKLSSLRVSADLDASGYVAGARQKADADQRMTASSRQVAEGQVAQILAFQRTGGAAVGLDRDLQRLLMRNDATYRSTTELARGQHVLQQAFDRGKIDAAGYTRQIDLLRGRLEAADRAQRGLSVGGLRSMAGSFGAGLGLGALASFADPTSIVLGVRQAVGAVDDLGDAAEKAGVSGERLQVLRYALEQNAGSAQDADNALAKFNKSIGEMALTGGGPAAAAMKALSIGIRDARGELRPTGELFDAVVDRLSRVSSQAQISAVSARLFGREAGSALAVTIGQGTDAMIEAEQRLLALGGVMSNETIASADKLDREFKDLMTTMSVSSRTAAVVVGEAFSNIQHSMAGLGQVTTDFFSNPSWRNFSKMMVGESGADRFTAPSEDERIGRAFQDAGGGRRDSDLYGALRRKALATTGDLIALPAMEDSKELESVRRKATQTLREELREQDRAREVLGRQRQGVDDLFSSYQRETAGIEANTSMLGQSQSVIAQHNEARRLEEQLLGRGIALTPQLTAMIDQEAAARVRATEAQQAAIEAQRASIARMDEMRSVGNDLFSGIRQGFESSASGGEILNGMLDTLRNKMLDMAQENLMDAIFGQMGTSGGGILGSIFSSLFAGGGATGGGLSTFGGPRAMGGYISGPGTGTSDSIPARLSNGEFVINAASTTRHRALLENINRGRMQDYARFAKGGFVGAGDGTAGRANIQVNNTVKNYAAGIEIDQRETRRTPDRIDTETIIRNVTKQVGQTYGLRKPVGRR